MSVNALVILLRWILFVGMLTGSSCNAAVDPAMPFNVLFLMADQMRFDAVSTAYRARNETAPKAFQTPNLDRIAQEGVTFQSAWSSTPTCTPARAALLTGMSPWKHGMLGYGAVAQHYTSEFPRILREHGKYLTASIGKDHFGWNASSDSGVGHGYDALSLYDGLGSWNRSSEEWVGENDQYDRWFAREMPGKDPMATLDPIVNSPNATEADSWNSWYGAPYVYDEKFHPTRWVGDRAVDFLNRYANSNETRPFLLKVSFHRPHSPYDPPKRLLDEIKAEDLPPIVTCAGASSGAESNDSGHGDKWCLRFRGGDGDPVGCGPSNPNAWCGEMPEANVTLSRRAYAASVRFVDEQIGRVYHALGDMLARTFILYVSDHGDGQGGHFHWRKGFPYEFSAHVPMLLRWPELWAQNRRIIPRGSVVRPPLVTELRDVFHTFVDAANLSDVVATQYGALYGKSDGKSLICLLNADDPSGAKCGYKVNPGAWRDHIDLEHSTCYNESNHWNALTDGKTKYIFRAFYGDEQLFDLVKDPAERREVSEDPSYADVLSIWRSKLVAQFVSEKRGSEWVSPNGTLMRRTQGQTYSPNYPGDRSRDGALW